MAIFHLLYISSAVEPFTKRQLVELLTASRVRNASAGISGLLLYKDGNIMQLIEGEEAAVRALFERIERDPRHRGTIVLSQGERAEREFADWSMGFRDLNSPEIRALPGYNEFMNKPLSEIGDASKCLKLLKLFRSKM